MERAEWNDARWLPVLVEEVGEVARILCDNPNDKDSLEEELIQVAAMASAWIDACNDKAPMVNNPLFKDDGMDK